jgi:UDP-N-acetylmuramoylalanine--D-glutamate ligase
MKNAVKFAYENTPKWKICLLSNAAPSFSLWKNFEEKWNIFQNEVKNYEK